VENYNKIPGFRGNPAKLSDKLIGRFIGSGLKKL
jgi:hypothetical protein